MKPPLSTELISAVRHFRHKKILVVGDVMLDVYVEGPPRFVSQEAPVVVIRVAKKFYKLGGAGNTAENIQALGGRAIVAGVLGNHQRHDDVGRSLVQTLRHSKIDRRGLLIDPSRPTTMKMRVMSQGQQIVRVDEEVITPIQGAIERRLVNFISKNIRLADAVLVSDYNKGVITPKVMKAVLTGAKKHRKKVVVDPRPDHRDLYRGVDVITPNEHELSNMFGQVEIHDRTLLGLAKRLQKQLRIGNILLTRGESGMDVIDERRQVTHIPTLATDVRDVSGAGDTVAAIAVLGLDTLPLPALAHLASIGAKISVSRVGTTAVTASQLLAEIKA